MVDELDQRLIQELQKSGRQGYSGDIGSRVHSRGYPIHW